MDTSKIRQKLHGYVEREDDKFVKMFYEMATVYLAQTERDKMILEAEEDIRAGRLHSSREVEIFIGNWTGQNPELITPNS